MRDGRFGISPEGRILYQPFSQSYVDETIYFSIVYII